MPIRKSTWRVSPFPTWYGNFWPNRDGQDLVAECLLWRRKRTPELASIILSTGGLVP